MYIQGSAIDKRFKGSLEHQALAIKEALVEHFDGSPVRILATHAKHAYAMTGDGVIVKVTYKVESKGGVTGIKSKPTKDIAVIEDGEIPAFVAGNFREMVEAALDGKGIPRTQVRETIQLLDKDEPYWISDVLEKIDEAIDSSAWHVMYETNQEKIRTAMHGRIRKIEAPFPSTKFAKISSSKLDQFESELREAVNLVAKLTTEMVDECTNMVFDQEQDEFFSVICESLKVEAQAVGGLLSKAEKLMRSEDVGRVAEAHDRLAERAKTMAVVTAYIKGKSRHNDDEE